MPATGRRPEGDHRNRTRNGGALGPPVRQHHHQQRCGTCLQPAVSRNQYAGARTAMGAGQLGSLISEAQSLGWLPKNHPGDDEFTLTRNGMDGKKTIQYSKTKLL